MKKSNFFKVNMVCYENKIGSVPYIDHPATDTAYTDYEGAFQYAISLAEEEADSLNDGCNSDRSFGVKIRNNTPTVVCYYDSGTDIVTEYVVTKI